MSQTDNRSDDAHSAGELDRVYLEVLIHLHESQIARFNRRRDVEWRLTFTLWGGLVLAANVMKDLTLPAWATWLSAILLLVVVVLHAVWEKRYVVRGAEPNRDVGIELENKIRGEIGLKEHHPQGYERWTANYWQVGVTVLLALLVVAAAIW